jgi:hypothetical protein
MLIILTVIYPHEPLHHHQSRFATHSAHALEIIDISQAILQLCQTEMQFIGGYMQEVSGLLDDILRWSFIAL